jgi:hypothetical protein
MMVVETWLPRDDGCTCVRNADDPLDIVRYMVGCSVHRLYGCTCVMKFGQTEAERVPDPMCSVHPLPPRA